jgi:hypothetical protein
MPAPFDRFDRAIAACDLAEQRYKETPRWMWWRRRRRWEEWTAAVRVLRKINPRRPASVATRHVTGVDADHSTP